jgi:transcription elongation GreA/GreB family factor
MQRIGILDLNMSRAFIKEQDEAQALVELPDRPISPHPNLVTAEGMAAIDVALARAEGDYVRAQAGGDHHQIASARRELRYWSARRSTAEIVAPPKDADKVHFGSRVTVIRADERRQSFRIVGKDEADPARGTLSYASPLARALAGKTIGEVVQAGNSEAEIVAIE